MSFEEKESGTTTLDIQSEEIRCRLIWRLYCGMERSELEKTEL